MKKEQLSWLLSCHILFLFSTTNNTVSVDAQCRTDQRSYLLNFKNSLKFDLHFSFNLGQWKPEEDCCSWGGVGYDASGRVTTLDLEDEGIYGAADNWTSLFRLQFLEKLILRGNNFNIPIPKAIANLTNLVYLSLSDSGFVGQIPIELSSLRKLVSFDLSTLNPIKMKMKLENPTLKMLIQNLSNIEEIYLNRVDLSAQGSEWSQVIAASLQKLRVLSLRDCDISGPIHISMSSIHNLSDIILDYNNISNEVPGFLANMPNLRTLSLSGCELVGQFPNKIFQVPTLQTLDISDNKLLQGRLSPSFGNLSMLSGIDLSHCNFSGSLSSTHFESLQSLETLNLGNNLFSGKISSSLFELTALKSIDLSNNQLSGQIDEIHSGLSMFKIQVVNLYSNQLNGYFPKFLFELNDLEHLSLSFNSFSDTIQLETFKNLHNLTYLDLSYNNLTIELQNYNSSLTKISGLYLASCKLTTFPQMQNNDFLFDLDLSDNEIAGEIPNWI